VTILVGALVSCGKSADLAPSPSAATAAPVVISRAQAAQVVAMLNGSIQHFRGLFAAGEQALGSVRYPDAQAGLAAMDDPNSAASRFSEWRQRSGVDRDATYEGVVSRAASLYAGGETDPALDTWAADMSRVMTNLHDWVETAVGWQIHERTDKDLEDAVLGFNGAISVAQVDAQQVGKK